MSCHNSRRGDVETLICPDEIAIAPQMIPLDFSEINRA